MYLKLLKQAIDAAFVAGDEILEVYNKAFEVEYKSDESPVTEADKRAGVIIEKMMESTGIPVLGEEGEHYAYAIRKNWERLWIVDPLDGTREFVKRNGEFTVNIALSENRKPVIGVIYSPVYKILYYAARSLGAYKITSHDVISFLNSQERNNTERLLEKGRKLPLPHQREKYTIVASRSHLSSDINNYVNRLKQEKGEVQMINTGSSIKMCLVAEGLADEYPRFGDTMEWDTCAGQCIVEQAGGSMIDCGTKQPLLYNREDLLNNWFIAKGPRAIS